MDDPVRVQKTDSRQDFFWHSLEGEWRLVSRRWYSRTTLLGLCSGLTDYYYYISSPRDPAPGVQRLDTALVLVMNWGWCTHRSVWKGIQFVIEWMNMSVNRISYLTIFGWLNEQSCFNSPISLMALLGIPFSVRGTANFFRATIEFGLSRFLAFKTVP